MDEKRGRLITVLLVGGGLLVYAGTQASSFRPGQWSGALWAILLGLPFFVFGFLLYQNGRGAAWAENILQKTSQWLGVTPIQAALVAMGPVFGYISVLAAGFSKRMYSPGWAVTAWILGITLILAGGWRTGEEKDRPSRTTLLWLAALIVLAFLLRGIDTARLPVILTGDEGSSGTSAAGFISGEWNNIFITSWFSFPSLFSFLQSLSIRVLGHTTEALRLVSAIAGALTVGCVYLVGRRLFGPRAGIFAALVLAAMHFHIHFSRIGLNNIWDGLWFTLSIGALCIGWEFNKRWGYLIAGLALGFGQYFYVSSRGLFGVVLAGLVFAVASQRKRLKEALPDIVLMIIAAMVVILPLASFYVEQPNQYLAPMARVSFLNSIQQSVMMTGEPAWLILFKRFASGMQAYTVTPVAFWYQPETPILRPVFAAFFYLGVVILLLKYDDSRSLLLLLWLLSFGVIAGLSDSVTPAAQRYVAAAPACALLAGLGLHGTTEMLETLWQKYRRAFAGLSVLILIAAMTSDVYFYYVDYYNKDLRNNTQSDGAVAQRVADLVVDKPEGTQVAFLNQTGGMGYYSIPSIQYLAPQVKGIDVPDPWSSFDRTSLNRQRLIFIILPTRQADVPAIQVAYPGGQLGSETALNGEVLFWVYELP